MKAYIDSDVILDYLYARPDFFKNAGAIFSLLEKKEVKGYVSSLIIWNLYYLLCKYFGGGKARSKIKEFRSLVNIVSVDSKIIDLALNSKIKDFEDSIQYFAAQSMNVDLIITRNKKDYPRNPVLIMNPTEFLNLIRSKDP